MYIYRERERERFARYYYCQARRCSSRPCSLPARWRRCNIIIHIVCISIYIYIYLYIHTYIHTYSIHRIHIYICIYTIYSPIIFSYIVIMINIQQCNYDYDNVTQRCRYARVIMIVVIIALEMLSNKTGSKRVLTSKP